MDCLQPATSRRHVLAGLVSVLLLGVLVAAPAGAHPSKEHEEDRARAAERTLAGDAIAEMAAAAALADPAQGSVSLESPRLTWAGQHYPAGATAFAGTTCQVPSELVCDHFRLSVDVEAAHWEDHHGGTDITITWPDAANDFDLHVFDADTGEPVGSSIDVNSSTGVPQEQVSVPNATGVYDVFVNPFDVVDSAYEGTVVLDSEQGLDPGAVPTERLSDVPCVDGMAGPFPCEGVDLLGFVPADEFDSAGISDIWGWTDPENGDEYVMLGKTNGTAFFRVSDPTDPVYLGELPNEAILQEVWHDIKVFDGHAFIVSESEPHGMTVFDLTRLRGVEEAREWDSDAFYPLNVAAHNIAINEDTGFAYILGGNAGVVAPDQCLSGLHMVDVNDPTTPTFAGCYLEAGGPGTAARTVGGPAEDNSPAAYVHDTQCVLYQGPDQEHRGREICINAAEDEIVIADVTDKLRPTTLGRLSYDDVGYAHQGWLTEDHRFFVANDELDEEQALTEGEPGMNTRTIVLDVTDLDEPKVHFEHFHETVSPDHNNYVHDGVLYQSNYSSGLRVLDTAFIDDGPDARLEPIGFFDTFPAHSDVTFDGTWSNYPFFESGTIAVSGRAEGLFLLRMDDRTPAGELGVDLVPGERPVRIASGASATAELSVTNVGEVDDTYSLQVADLPAGWTATVAPPEVTVAAGDTELATVTIEVPAAARPGPADVTVTATSTTDEQVSDAAVVPVVVTGAGSAAGGPTTSRAGDGAAPDPGGATSVQAAGARTVPASLAGHADHASSSRSMLASVGLLLVMALALGWRRGRRPS